MCASCLLALTTTSKVSSLNIEGVLLKLSRSIRGHYGQNAPWESTV